MIRKVIFILAMIGMASVNVQAQKKAPKSESGNVLGDFKKALFKKYKYQSIDVYILAGKLNIDIADIHVKYLPKDIRAERSKEIAEFSRSFFDKTPAGKQMIKGITSIGINHLNKSGGGALTSPKNTYERYTF